MEITPSLAKFIAVRDKRIHKLCPWKDDAISEKMTELITRGVIRVGGRATCGSSIDPTWKEYCAWNEVVAKANKSGFKIEVIGIKHGNSWATKSGGFWDENEYKISV